MTPRFIFVNLHSKDIPKQNHPGGLRKPEPAGVIGSGLIHRITGGSVSFFPGSAHPFSNLITMKPLPARFMNS